MPLAIEHSIGAPGTAVKVLRSVDYREKNRLQRDWEMRHELIRT